MNSEVISSARRLQAANDRGNLFGLRAEFADAIRTIYTAILNEPAVFKVGQRVRLKTDVQHFMYHPGEEFTIDRIDRDGDLWCGHVCVNAEKAEPLDASPAPEPEKPRYQHDCDKCVFLGGFQTDTHRDYDLYYCGKCLMQTVIARYGEGSLYASGLGTGMPVLIEAERRARERGLLQASPAPDGERQVGDAPVIDHEELKAKAWEIFLAGMSGDFCDAAEAFDLAAEFLTESARREGEC